MIAAVTAAAEAGLLHGLQCRGHDFAVLLSMSAEGLLWPFSAKLRIMVLVAKGPALEHVLPSMEWWAGGSNPAVSSRCRPSSSVANSTLRKC